MENLNETAARVNRLLNDFEEPIRAMLPQLTRTVKMADDLSKRLADPVDQVIPGLTRLADTLNSPVLRVMPTDLGQFMEIINDLGRRMSPLAQLAEQAGAMFGLRVPGLSRQAAPSVSAAPVTATAVSSHARPSAAAARGAVQDVWAGDCGPGEEADGSQGAGQEGGRQEADRPQALA